jgi:hypothetical protein
MERMAVLKGQIAQQQEGTGGTITYNSGIADVAVTGTAGGTGGVYSNAIGGDWRKYVTYSF